VRASPLAERGLEQCDFGLYMDARWAPTWPAELIDWQDFGLPRDPEAAAAQIRNAFARAESGERVEVGCAGGLGRTGTVLACMAVLAGVPAEEAVTWVRQNYDVRAVETPEQEAWVRWFAFRTV
jgi:protein-tyrosine phosphatase